MTMDTVVIKYNAGNLRSVEFALSRLGVEPVFSDEAETILKAQRIIFPGVGEASSAMKYLRERQLDEVILAAKQPFLGICLGMQLMCKHSEENDTTCLGIFDESVKKFNPTDPALKVPQIGWNTIANLKTPVFTDIPEDSIATTDYGGLYSAALKMGNYYGVQFHPEKSAAIGQKIIENFLKIE
jgi:glutamine amidotransferase